MRRLPSGERVVIMRRWRTQFAKSLVPTRAAACPREAAIVLDCAIHSDAQIAFLARALVAACFDP